MPEFSTARKFEGKVWHRSMCLLAEIRVKWLFEFSVHELCLNTSKGAHETEQGKDNNR
jgi:hypothetical protein